MSDSSFSFHLFSNTCSYRLVTEQSSLRRSYPPSSSFTPHCAKIKANPPDPLADPQLMKWHFRNNATSSLFFITCVGLRNFLSPISENNLSSGVSCLRSFVLADLSLSAFLHLCPFLGSLRYSLHCTHTFSLSAYHTLVRSARPFPAATARCDTLLITILWP